MHILLIEDHEDIANNIQKFLALENMQVDIANDGKLWLEQFQNKHYDFVLLDWMLPNMSGIEILKEIRKTREVPILMMTAKWQLNDKLEWFDTGADDYLVKPFDLEELVVRIKTIMKRFEEPDTFTYDKIEINLDSKKIFNNGKEITLALKEYQILEYLIGNQGYATSRSDIVDHIWGWEALFEQDSKLDVYISTLRKKLDKSLIQTIKWFGYKIEK